MNPYGQQTHPSRCPLGHADQVWSGEYWFKCPSCARNDLHCTHCGLTHPNHVLDCAAVLKARVKMLEAFVRDVDQALSKSPDPYREIEGLIARVKR